MGHQDGVADGSYVPKRVEILGHHQQRHHFVRVNAVDPFLEIENRVAQSVDDCLALAGNALPRQGFCLRLAHQGYFVCLRARFGGDLFTASGVDIVHGTHDCVRGYDFCNEGVFDGVAKFRHNHGQAVLYALGDLVFLLVGFIQVNFGNVAENHVFDVGLDLVLRVVEFVIGFLDAVGKHEILDADWYGDRRIVLGLRHNGNIHQLHIQVFHVDLGLKERYFEIQPWSRNAMEFSEPLDNASLFGVDDEAGKVTQQDQECDSHEESDPGKQIRRHAMLL